jgi:nucleotide-binding universal stress UspA family protein
MFPLKCVLCPIDFSDHSRRVLAWSAALAARDGAQLVVASFLEPLLSDAAATIDVLDELQRDTRAQIVSWIDGVAPRGTAWTRQPIVIARRGSPDEEILRVAEEHQADLIVMGTHGLTGVRKLVLGSTTARVLRHTDRPVLAVPFGAHGLAEGAEPTIERVLVATDLTDSAPRYAAAAIDLARSFHASVTLVHVLEGESSWGGGKDTTVHHRVRAIRAAQQLEELADRLTPLWTVETIRRCGSAADEIAVAAVERRASIIVMGLLSRHGAIPRRPGTVAYRVMCLSAVPVLVLPPAPAGGALVHESGALAASR